MELINCREAAKRISVSRALIYRWHASGRTPYARIFVKISRRLLVDAQRLDELVDSLRAEPVESMENKIIVLKGIPKDEALTL